jgi:hypothetical protein
VIKYQQALAALRVLDMIAAGTAPEDDGLIEVHRDDLVPFLRLMGGSSNPDSPLRRLEDAAEPWRETAQEQEEQS